MFSRYPIAPELPVASLERLRSKLPPATHCDKLFNEISNELHEFLNPSQLTLVDRICCLIEHDYREKDNIGKGYHCLEHNLEVAVLILKSSKHLQQSRPKSSQGDSISLILTPSELLELTVAALLHDYDPHCSGEPPRVERTLYAIKTDDIFKELLEKLNVNISNLALLIERTDYPFTADKLALWNAKVLFYFKNSREKNRFIQKSEMLALFDKGSPYYYLSPEDAHKRVEALADELNCSKEKLLYCTPDFFEKENVSQMSRYLPEKYVQRWFLMERYFKNLALLMRNPDGITH